QLIDTFRNCLEPTGSETCSQVFFHAEQGKDLSPLRHIADAQAGTGFHSLSSEIHLSGIVHLPATYRHLSHDGLHQGGLAHTIASQYTGTGTSRHVQIKVPQGMTLTVILIQPLKTQHQVTSSSPPR